MALEMPATLVCTALQMAIMQRNPAAGLVVHSDWGTQYVSALHQELLKQCGLIGSMYIKITSTQPTYRLCCGFNSYSEGAATGYAEAN